MKLKNKYEYKIPKIWFYEIKGVEDVATSQEIKIANGLSNFRAKIFLESRGYIRQSLATIFNLHPLEIPIIANPGEPPELPKKMGHVSISHCNDAIIIAWHEKKIGIDIERKDRPFNHKSLAKKYFFQSYQSNPKSKLNRTSVLNQWCALEAAIKWDQGKLAEDIKEWQYFKDKKKLFHKKKKLNLKFTQINFYEWTISLAHEENISFQPNLICSPSNF